MEHHHSSDRAGRSLFAAIVLNFGLSAVQVVGGIVSGSLSLIADALHNTSDAVSLVLAYLARKWGLKPPDRKRTFGYKKIETVTALINLTATLVIAFYIVIEAILRLFEQKPIDGVTVVWISVLAILVDFGTVGLTYAFSKNSLNFKAAFLHNLADGLASVGVLISGLLIIWLQIYWVDVLAALMISVFIVVHSYKPMKESIRVLIDSAPEGVDLQELEKAIESHHEVASIHHLHVWHIAENRAALEAHIVLKSGFENLESIKTEIKALLERDFDIDHSSLEFENALSDADCHKDKIHSC